LKPGSSEPRLSVVIPTHDTREITLRCLASLEPWTADGVEVVLVDDGSRDGTAEAVQGRFPAVGVLRSATARGFTASANEGLAAARGELLLLLNSDTEVEPATLPHLFAAFEADPQLGAAGAVLTNPDGSPQWSGGPEPTLSWLFLLASGLGAGLGRVPGYRLVRPLDADSRGAVDWVTGAAVAIRREAWEAVGPMDVRYRFYAQDLDFCLSLRDAGWHVGVATGFRVMHLGGATIAQRPGATKSANPALLWADLLTWAEKRKGAHWARTARRWMALGGGLHLLARWAGRACVPRERREGWDRDTSAFRAATRELRAPK
jgi:N-acetylglucosaminyl-diphospho-decaprenol L-rhamnosyltransferase